MFLFLSAGYMDEYKYFARINKLQNKIIELIMATKKPDLSYTDNLEEVIEITLDTFCTLAYDSAETGY